MNKQPILTRPKKIVMIIFRCKDKIAQAVCINVIDAEEDDTCPQKGINALSEGNGFHGVLFSKITF
jgi:hypothetical protein